MKTESILKILGIIWVGSYIAMFLLTTQLIIDFEKMMEKMRKNAIEKINNIFK